MRWTLLVFTAVSLTALCVAEAAAHGGGGFRGPYRTRTPNMPCDCAKVDCLKCSAPGLVTGEDLSRRETKIEVVEAWGDVGRVRITAVFETEQKQRFLEAHAEVRASPLLAITAGRIQSGQQVLEARLAPSREARRDYLWERHRSLRDPLLVSRRDAATLHVRAFPISEKKRTTVTLEGFALLPVPRLTVARVYRSGDQCVVVRPLTAETELHADVVDVESGRALFFMHVPACARLFPALLKGAIQVPCVGALFDAVTGKGDAAVNERQALVALLPGRRAPSNLFIGKPKDAPWITIGPPPSPPGSQPPDPPPPPPTPPAPPAPDKQT